MNQFFYPIDTDRNDNLFRVFYFGTYLPLQGIDYIIQAAKKLECYEDIEFTIVGKGIEYNKIMNYVQELDVKNIRFIDWIPYEELPMEIAKTDICLGGHFSNIDKAKRVISGKTYIFIAMKKAVVMGDNLANGELFKHKKNAMLVEMGNADALAEGILELKIDRDLRERIAENGFLTFKNECSSAMIGEETKQTLKLLIIE